MAMRNMTLVFVVVATATCCFSAVAGADPKPPRNTPPPKIPSIGAVATVSPASPVVMVVGDSIDFTVSMWLSPYWPSSVPARLSVTVPGNQTAITAALGYDHAFDIEQFGQSAGTCTPQFTCDFGQLPGGSVPYMAMRLRAKEVGSYQLIAHPDFGPSVTVPVTVVPRRGDLALAVAMPDVSTKVGRTTTRRVMISNSGPNVVADAAVTVGAPRSLSVTATVVGGTCTTVPIRCTVPPLAPGQNAQLTLVTTARRAGRFGIPIGVSSPTAQDLVRTNNTSRLVLAVR
jgi:Domain of unknown function DUF11